MTQSEEPIVVEAPDAGVMTAISRAELDSQITTARAYPRSVRKFIDECMEMACLNEEIAEACIYALPRGGKSIEGPSARLAEIVTSAWGNCRAGARVVEEGREFITAQGVFHDLERNVQITIEVRRRITNKYGKRFDSDMIGVTGNAACSIALRNAVFKGISKAFWEPIYKAARRAAVGDAKTLASKRADALAYLQKRGATEEQVLATLDVKGVEDIGLDELVVLKGLATAIKEGDTTVEQAFAPPEKPPEATGGAKSASDAIKKKKASKKAKKEKEAPPEDEYPETEATPAPRIESEEPPDCPTDLSTVWLRTDNGKEYVWMGDSVSGGWVMKV